MMRNVSNKCRCDILWHPQIKECVIWSRGFPAHWMWPSSSCKDCQEHLSYISHISSLVICCFRLELLNTRMKKGWVILDAGVILNDEIAASPQKAENCFLTSSTHNYRYSKLMMSYRGLGWWTLGWRKPRNLARIVFDVWITGGVHCLHLAGCSLMFFAYIGSSPEGASKHLLAIKIRHASWPAATLTKFCAVWRLSNNPTGTCWHWLGAVLF